MYKHDISLLINEKNTFNLGSTVDKVYDVTSISNTFIAVLIISLVSCYFF
ncbi:hypothetical protein ONB70_01870 [Candidatus Purcelliella pentastirinorum]|nr:hypothetical protein [Candidatus Purcelliella pentastirinorum]WDR80433.1 hypothetical protein ONB70_01870 [Candidatus Purcelliella pentastirinorum]